MKIVRVKATPLNVPVTIDILGMHHTTSLSVCLTEIESDTGLIGHGLTGITEEEIIAAAVREVAAPALIGEDPLATERLWEKLYWLLSPRGQTGYASHVIAQARALQPAQALKVSEIAPVPTSAFPTPARRPLNSRLSTRKLQQTFGLVLPPWQQGVDRMLREIL